MTIARYPSEVIDLADLTPWPRNYNNHETSQVEALASSLSTFGQFKNIVAARRNSRVYILAGHGLAEAARQAGERQIEVKFVPDDWPDEKLEALLVADNRLPQLATPDDEKLAELLASVRANDEALLAAVGYGSDEVDELLRRVGAAGEPGADTEPEVDRAEELRQKWGVEAGQLWALGKHRLLVGDGAANCATNATVIVDPEWNDGVWIDIGAFRDALVFFDNNHIATTLERYGPPRWLFSWDCCTTWYVQGKPLLQAKFCAWYGEGQYVQDGWRYGESSFPAGKHANGRGSKFDYKPHEDGRILSDIFRAPIVQVHSDGLNSHSKPLDWMTALIANCTSGDVSDPFAGSGTAIIASEKLGRRCDACEVDPAMAAVIIQRCEDFGLRVRRSQEASE